MTRIVSQLRDLDTGRIAEMDAAGIDVKVLSLNSPGVEQRQRLCRPAVANLIAGRVQALYTEKWVPLDVILSADHDSPYYNEKSKAGSLCNEGWSLVHMLALNQEYRPKFNALLNEIANGSPSIMALVQKYGKPLAAIKKDLQAYMLQGFSHSR